MVGGGGPHLPSGVVVVGGHLGIAEEGEQVRAELAAVPSQALAVAMGERQRHVGAKRTFEPPATFAPGARGASSRLLGMALLRAVKVGHPKRREMPVQRLDHHTRAAAIII